MSRSDDAPEPTTRAGRELLRSFGDDEPFTRVIVKLGIAAIEAAARADAEEEIFRLERRLQACEEAPYG